MAVAAIRRAQTGLEKRFILKISSAHNLTGTSGEMPELHSTTRKMKLRLRRKNLRREDVVHRFTATDKPCFSSMDQHFGRSRSRVVV